VFTEVYLIKKFFADLNWVRDCGIQVCRALLSLAQKNISFGKMLTNEHRAKTLVLNNIADVPLLYKIKKTGKNG
jgi:hypothetical protein